MFWICYLWQYLQTMFWIFGSICVRYFGSIIFDFDNICVECFVSVIFDNICVRCFGSVIFDNICIQCFGYLTIFSSICYKSLTIFVSDVLDLLSLTEYWKWARNWREWWFLLGDNTKRDIYLWNIILGHSIHNHTFLMHWHLKCQQQDTMNYDTNAVPWEDISGHKWSQLIKKCDFTFELLCDSPPSKLKVVDSVCWPLLVLDGSHKYKTIKN